MFLAGDGEEGLWLAESNPYAAIVLDIMLPKRDGLSVLSTLRQRGSIDIALLKLSAMRPASRSSYKSPVRS